MEPNERTQQLRKKLVGVKWQDFQGENLPVKGRILIDKTIFFARFGFFMGREVVAVFAEGNFIAVTPVPAPGLGFIYNPVDVINPLDPSAGYIPKTSLKLLEEAGIIYVMPQGEANDQHA